MQHSKDTYIPLTPSDTFPVVELHQWRSKVGVGPCAKIPKGPPCCPLQGSSVCSANKQPPYSGNFWVGL